MNDLSPNKAGERNWGAGGWAVVAGSSPELLTRLMEIQEVQRFTYMYNSSDCGNLKEFTGFSRHNFILS